MKLLLVSEGGRDIGDGLDKTRVGAVGALVEQVLNQEPGARRYEIETSKLFRLHGAPGYARKVHMAIVEAETRGCSGVVVVIDRDRTPGHERLQELRKGREAAEQAGYVLAFRTALGVAVECVEAWLLADEAALTLALGLEPAAQAYEDPEGLSHNKAKECFLKVVARGTRSPDHYAAVARVVRLAVLEARCSAGFARFAQELRDRLVQDG